MAGRLTTPHRSVNGENRTSARRREEKEIGKLRNGYMAKPKKGILRQSAEIPFFGCG
jgi:hypothetical protein